jgi:hypothetical protein
MNEKEKAYERGDKPPEEILVWSKETVYWVGERINITDVKDVVGQRK